MPRPSDPISGFGLGLRPQHFPDVVGATDDNSVDRPVDWFEFIAENYMDVGGMPMRNLLRVRERYPMAMHGVSLSIGAPDPLNEGYLKSLKKLIDRVEPSIISDHLCWTGAHGKNMHDLLPLPLNEETLAHVAERVQRVQDILGRRIALENTSSYVTFTADTMTEWDFISALVARADCQLLLDVNNVYVSAFNHGFNAIEFIDGIPGERVAQIHLAGHENNGDHIVDTHDAPVVDGVWDLYAETIKRIGSKPTMIERDGNIPPFADLVAELNHARRHAANALAEVAA